MASFEGWQPAVPFEEAFDAQYGLEIVDESAGGPVDARVAVTDRVLNHLGAVHGGVYAAVAETIASRGTATAVVPGGRLAMGLSNDTTVIELVTEGAIHAHARACSRGDDMWVWTVEAHDDAGRLCAFSRVTVAVRTLGP